MKQKLVCLFLTLAMLVCPLTSCKDAGPAPALEDIYDEVVALIEASHSVNDAVFGQGLPVHAIDSDYALEHHIYKDTDYATYQYVTADSPFHSTGAIKAALLAVYSADYVESLSSVLFDGFAMGTKIVHAQLYEQNGYLMQRTDYEPLFTQKRIYDYSSMRLVKPSNAQHLTIEVKSHLEGEDATVTDTLSLVLEEDGWRLDEPTF